MKKKAPKLLTLLLIAVLTLSQSSIAYATQEAVTNSDKKTVNIISRYSQKDGVTYYYEPGQSDPVYAAKSDNYGKVTNYAKKETVPGNKIIPDTKNVKKGTLKNQQVNEKKANTQTVENNTKEEILKFKHTNRPKYAAGEVLVKFKSGISEAAKNSLYDKYQFKKDKTLKMVGSDIIKLPNGTSVEEAIKILKSEKNVESAQPNYIYYPDDFSPMPNDPLVDQLWGLENTGQEILGVPGIVDTDIDLSDAWQTTQGDSSTIIGIIDTGIDINHPDLQGRIWTNPAETADNGIDDDGNGYIDDIYGWDFYNQDNTVFDPEDGDNHATHVAGTIAADLDNSTGVAGIAPNVKIMSLKFLGPYGGYTSDAIEAIEYAKNMNVKILNNSWGGGDYDALLEFAIGSSDALFVASAGNDGWDNDVYYSYPASYSNDNILSVAAVDNRGELAYFSNYGVNTVDVAAPGVGILSTVPRKPTLGAAIQSDNGTYKTLYQSFGLESVSTVGEQIDLMTRSLQFFGVTGTDKVLLVQDDESDMSTTNPYYVDFLGVYMNAILASGHNPDVFIVPASGNGPGPEVLNQYKLVIWFTGNGMGIYNYGQCLSELDMLSLMDYLNNGGSVYLSGRDAGWNIESTDFYNNYLHTQFLFEDDLMPAVFGVSPAFAGSWYNLNNTIYMDYLKPSDSIGQAALNFEGESDYSQAYAYYNGTSMAAPHVTGIAALLYSNGIQDPLQIKSNIMGNVTQLDSLNGMVFTSGMVNANAALMSQPDDDIPGVELKESNVGTLDQDIDLDDVYYVDLVAGQEIKLGLSGDEGTDFDLHIFGPDAITVDTAYGLLASSEASGTSTEALDFRAEYPGRYYVDVYGYAGRGAYTLTYQNMGCIIDDKDIPPLEYEGNWIDLTQSAYYYNETAKQLNSPGSVCYSFVGSNVKWTGSKNPTQGYALVYIDGELRDTVDLYSSSAQYKQVLSDQDVSYGYHTLEIKWAGMWDRRAKKTCTAINIDSIEVASEIVKPASPANLEAYGYMNEIGLYFEYNNTENINFFIIYRAEDGVNFHSIDTIYPYSPTELSFAYYDENVANKEYSYKVTAVDYTGNESDPSNTATATPLISNSDYELQDTSNHVQYTGTWTTVSSPEYSGGTIHVTEEEGGITEIPFTGYKSSLILQCGPDMGTVKVTFPDLSGYNLTVDLYDPIGGYWTFGTNGTFREIGQKWIVECISGKANFDVSEIYDLDVDAPTAPTNLTGVKDTTSQDVTLSWPDNPEPDVKGYNVYRSTTAGAGYEKLNTNPVTDLQFVDTTLGDTGNYYYTISAVDYAGLESGMSNEVVIEQAPSVTPVGPGIYEDTDSSIQYFGNWSPYSNTKYSGGTIRLSGTAGDYIQLTFTGTGVRWIGCKANIRGIANVVIDNGDPISVDAYNSTNLYQVVLFEVTDLPNTTHTIKIMVTGTRNASSTKNLIDVDAFEVLAPTQQAVITRYEDNNGNIQYVGSWSPYSNTKYSEGTIKLSGTTDDYIQYTFTGTGIKWIGCKANIRGIANVVIDNGDPISVDAYNSTNLYQVVLFEVTDLPNTTHTIKIMVTGTRNASSTKNLIDVDAFDVTELK